PGQVLLLLGERRQLLEEMRDQLPADPDLAFLHHVERLAEQRRVDVAIAVASDARLERSDAFAFVRMTRQHDDLRARPQPLDRLDAGDTAEVRQLEIQEHRRGPAIGQTSLERASLRHLVDGETAVDRPTPSLAQRRDPAGDEHQRGRVMTLGHGVTRTAIRRVGAGVDLEKTVRNESMEWRAVDGA